MLGLLASGPARAEPERPLTLAEAIRLAQRHHALVLSADADVERASARVARARSGFLPRISLTAGSILFEEAQSYRIPPGGMSIDLSSDPLFGALLKQPITNPKELSIGVTNRWINFGLVSLTQPLFTGGMILSYHRMARHGRDAARSGRERQVHEVVHTVIRRYHDAVLASRLLELGERVLTRVRAVHSVTARVHEAGSPKVNRLDYLKSKLTAATVAGVVEKLREGRRLALEGLRFAIGLEPGQRVRPAKLELVEPRLGEGCEAGVARALRSRPEVAQLESGVKALRAGVGAAWSRYLPDLALTAGYLIDDKSIRFTDGHTFYAALVARFTLFEGLHTRAEVAEARAKLASLEHKRRYLASGISAQVRKACIERDRAGAALKLARESLADAEEYLALAERSYQADLIGFDEVFKAQLAEALARGQELKLRYDLANALADWSRDVGDLSAYSRGD